MAKQVLETIRRPRTDGQAVWGPLNGLTGYMALPIAHRRGLFQLLEGKRLSAAEIGDALALQPRSVGALLSALTSLGLLELVDERYGLTVEAEVVLVATGRRPNSDRLALGATGVKIDEAGHVAVDEHQRTNVDGIFALGDISSPYELKHVANHEERVVQHNLQNPADLVATDHRFVPSAVFTHPQIASVGLTEEQATARGVGYVTGRYEYAGVAAGWAREDITGFVNVLADPESGLLLGAHIIGPEAATVIQPLIQAMSLGQTARQVAEGQYWIHPALPEIIENALLQLWA